MQRSLSRGLLMRYIILFGPPSRIGAVLHCVNCQRAEPQAENGRAAERRVGKGEDIMAQTTSTIAAEPTKPAAGSTVWSAVGASTIGTLLEWYDFFIYGTATALIFNKLFFPNFDPVAGVLASWATYAIGFAIRPIGALFFAHLGDRIGRRS
jgi:hypothetical protein